MSLVRATDLSLSFGAKTLLEGASFSIGPQDRIGLVGANGTGKSTLLRLLVAEISPDRGSFSFRRGVRVGYLPQELGALLDGGLVEALLRSVPGRDVLEERLRATERQLEASTDDEELTELAGLLAELHEELDHFEERFGRRRAERILAGLGFSPEAFARPTTELSGGWRMRAALAGLLLQDPDLLLLDEPTNHLDLPSLTWFDGFLNRSRKALVLISHDRRFLNRHIRRVLSLELEGLRSWAGNYDDYQRLRAEEAERLLAQAERQAAKRAQLEAFVTRFRAKASKAAQAQSKQKQLDRLEAIEVHQARETLGFRFPPAPPCGREVARLERLSKRFGARTIYREIDAQILKGQRIAVVGVNGAGKTTLLKLVAGELAPDEGRVVLGHNVVLGYFAQHHAETLDPTRSVLEEMEAWVPDKPVSFIRRALGAFLFSGDDVDKRIGVLSGGERARVALARLLLRPANFLVMDEPTNHLDLDASEALIEALEDYDGTILFVSHNQSFLNALATHVWDVRDGSLVPFPGNLDEYLHHLEIDAAERGQPAEARGEESAVERSGRPADRRRAEAEARQARARQLGPLKARVAALERRIAELEAAQREREVQLADAAFVQDYVRARPVMEAHRQSASELERLMADWEAASEALEAASESPPTSSPVGS